MLIRSFYETKYWNPEATRSPTQCFLF